MHGRNGALMLERTCAGIGVLLDMHAAPGSQNGMDNSAPAQPGKTLWGAASQPTPSYPDQTVAFIGALAARYADAPALIGFTLMSSPQVLALIQALCGTGHGVLASRGTFTFVRACCHHTNKHAWLFRATTGQSFQPTNP